MNPTRVGAYSGYVCCIYTCIEAMFLLCVLYPCLYYMFILCGCIALSFSVSSQYLFVLGIISLRACARGKAIGLSVVVIVVGMKIARFRVLGICASCKHNQSVDISEKLVCMRFELLKKAY